LITPNIAGIETPQERAARATEAPHVAPPSTGAEQLAIIPYIAMGHV